MKYTIKAIPTLYRGARFRSRLEARWAAFFDLVGLDWDYEPFDLGGWNPDFTINTKFTKVLVEVKPFDVVGMMDRAQETGEFDVRLDDYTKALNWRFHHQVCLLGVEPPPRDRCLPIGLPVDPPLGAKYTYDDIIAALTFEFETPESNLWFEAGSLVQWKGISLAA